MKIKNTVISFDGRKVNMEEKEFEMQESYEKYLCPAGDLDRDPKCIAEELGYRKYDIETALHLSKLDDVHVICPSGNPRAKVAYVKYIKGLTKLRKLGCTPYDIERLLCLNLKAKYNEEFPFLAKDPVQYIKFLASLDK